ncbi:unnamed protein product [Symbiodinium sp. CCMP2592]|nr:unnamed protein product [Symbiodinium sp. CCMP2592]
MASFQQVVSNWAMLQLDNGFNNIVFKDTEMQPHMRRRVSYKKPASHATQKRPAIQKWPATVVLKRFHSYSKARKELEEKAASVNLHKGDRVWTRCWVRVAQPGPEGGMDMPQKSKKPELGMIAEESEDGNFFVIQFESKEHELERLAMLEKKRYRRIRPWLRYPRFFEGKTQKIKRDWIQTSRPPPRLCSCKRQEWGHECPCGITCKRVSRPDVWGVDQ